MEGLLSKLLIVCPLVFIAGLADSIAGGGGIISVPAYLFAGIPIHTAYGTNKFAMSLGTTISAGKYIKSGNYSLKSALFAASGAIIGSITGARLALITSEKILQTVLIILLPIAALVIFLNRGFGKDDAIPTKSGLKLYIISLLIGLIVGCYDGFFGPGAGTFYVILFVLTINYPMRTASGNAKIVNLASNIGALATYLINVKVDFYVGIPAAVCAILGNFIGASLAIKNGSKLIRPIVAVVLILLLIKILTDVF